MAIFYSSLGKLIQRVTFISVIKTRKLKLREEGFSPRYPAIHHPSAEMRFRSGPVLLWSLCALCDVMILSGAASLERHLLRFSVQALMHTDAQALPVEMPTHWTWGRATAPVFLDKHSRWLWYTVRLRKVGYSLSQSCMSAHSKTHIV